MKPDPSISVQSGDTTSDADGDSDSLPLDTMEVLSGDLRKREARRIAAPTHVGDYELLGEIARGGMGVVYKARHIKLDKLVALKVLSPHLTGDVEAVKRFEREMKAVGRVDHPNIVRAMDAGQVGDTHYLVMEYVDGTDLQRLVKAKGPRPIGEACRLVREAAIALAYAHAQGLTHRDLKPSNLILTQEGQLKVLDLGLARLGASSDSLTTTGASLGTPDYMAPEQWTNIRLVDHRSDLYALGCTLFFLLTARPPFGDEQHSTVASKMAAHIYAAPPALTELLPNASLELQVIYRRLLAKQREDRIPSAMELAKALTAHSDVDSTANPSLPSPQKLNESSRRKQVRLLLTLCGFLLVIASIPVGNYITGSRTVADIDPNPKQTTELSESETFPKSNTHDASLQAQRQLADTQKYYALMAEVRLNAVARKPGWTWLNQQKLAEAAVLDTPAMDEYDLRTQAAEALGAFDMREHSTLDTIFHVTAMECAPNGEWIALAQLKDWLACTVQVRSLPEGNVLHKLRFPCSALYQATSTRQDGTSSLAVSDDSRWIAVGTRSGMIHLWDLQSQAIEPRSWQCDDSETNGLRFYPDGQRLLSCSSKGVFKSWSLEDLQCTVVAAELGDWSNLPISPDRRLIASHRGLHSAADFAKVSDLEETSSRQAFHPSGRLLAQASGRTLQLINVSTGRICRTFVDPELEYAHEEGIRSLAFHPRGSWLASCNNRRLKVWEVASGSLLASVVIGPNEEGRVAFTVDGRYLAVTGDRKVVKYELGGLIAQSFVAHEPFPITAIDMAGDDRGLACLSEAMRSAASDYHAEVSTWNPATGDEQQRTSLNLSHTDKAPVSPSITFDREGQLLAVTPASGDLCLLATSEGQPLTSIGGNPTQRGGAITFSPDGNHLAGLVGEQVIWWQLPSLDVAGHFTDTVSARLFGSSWITALGAYGDGLLLATSDKHLHRLSLSSGTISGRISVDQSPTALAIAPDQSWCAVGMLNRELRIVSLPGGEELERADAHSDSVIAVAISQDQSWLASVGRDRQLLLWRRDQGRLQRFLSLVLPGKLNSLRFSATADKLFLLLERERAIRVWDLKQLQEQTAGLLTKVSGVPAAQSSSADVE